MALPPGTRLGAYELTARIGEGGMGEVYRATDTNLKRQVALKMLPASLAGDADRLARFQREAEVLAALNHPNIAQVYGLEKSLGVTALVMELVEGEDLSQRIARGSIPLEEALPIARQIAEALEAAHEQGIIHRDLKPANIKVRPDGTAKVLDFGLAKAIEPASTASTSASLPTITTPAMTQAGMILGTAAYMSPEQSRGRAVDKRGDIWAFGCVLYEMLTGVRAFPGEDITDTLVSVVSREPNWGALPTSTPPGLRRCLARCLRKDARARIRDIGEARQRIEELLSGTPEDTDLIVTAHTVSRSTSARALPWTVVAALTAALGVSVWAPWRSPAPVDRPLLRLHANLGTGVSLPSPAAAGSHVIISPDGTRLVFASGAPRRLFTRRLDQPEATEMPGTQGAEGPFFSPDGQWVGFTAAGTLKKISVEGGAVVPLGVVGNTHGASWGEDGSIVIGASRRGLLRIPDTGGPPETIAEPVDPELGLVQPTVLPGGLAVLFAADNAGPVDRTTIEALTLTTKHRTSLVRGGASPRYVLASKGRGHLVYVNGTRLFAMPFDLDTLTARGSAVSLVDDLAHESLVGGGEFDVSRNGTLVYVRARGGSSEMRTVQWVDPDGTKAPLLAKPGVYRDPSLSADGKRLALTATEGVDRDVWVYDLPRDAMTRLTFGGTNAYPRWTPDGRYVVFSSVGNGIFLARADGASQPRALTANKAIQYPWSFTPDGKRLAYYEDTEGRRLWSVPLEDQGGQLTAGTPEPLLESRFADQAPSFSPDGRWLAYHSNESGIDEVYVRAFPPPSGQGGKWQVSSNGGSWPRWSRNGRELVYRSGDQLMAVAYTVSGDTFIAAKPRVWLAKVDGIPGDLARDGTRVMVLTSVDSSDSSVEHEVVFLLNFFDELRRRAPLSR